MTLQPTEKTLTDAEIDAVSQKIVGEVGEEDGRGAAGLSASCGEADAADRCGTQDSKERESAPRTRARSRRFSPAPAPERERAVPLSGFASSQP